MLQTDSASSDRQIPTADLVSLDFSTESTADAGQPMLELVDGTKLPIDDVTTDAHTLRGKLSTPLSATPRPIAVPLEQVRAVRLQPLDPAILPQWHEILTSGMPSDLLVLVKRGGRSLDYLEGVVGAITDEDVAFTLEGKTVQVARSKVAGLVYYRTAAAPTATPQCILLGKDGARLTASSVSLRGASLDVVTMSGLRVVWPLSSIASADFSAGKIVFLGDLTPASQTWQPLVGLPPSASRAAKFGQPRFNHSATGGPLSLTFPNDSPAGGSLETETFAKGLAVRSRSELVYRLPSGYSRFMAVAGIEPADATNGNVALTVFGDDQLLTEANIAGSSQPLRLDLDVTGVKRLKIVVDYGQNLDTGDWLNLCNARIVK